MIQAKILLSLGLFLFVNSGKSNHVSKDVFDNNVKWMTLEQAVLQLEQDKSEGKKTKLIFIDIFTNWCGWCKKMDKETFEHPNISKYINDNFYPVKLNAEQREDIIFQDRTYKYISNGRRGYHELAASLMGGKMSYPTVVFLNEELKILQRLPGYLDAKAFDKISNYLVGEHYKNTSWKKFDKTYKSDF